MQGVYAHVTPESRAVVATWGRVHGFARLITERGGRELEK
jgi:hypothetical protein